MRVPIDSIAGSSVTRNVVIYTYAPQDSRHFVGVDEKISRTTEYLLSVPIPSVFPAPGSQPHTRSAGALQLLFDENILPDANVADGPREFDLASLRNEEGYEEQLSKMLWTLPIIAFGMEVLNLRQTSHQAIHELKNKLIAGLSWVNYLRADIKGQNPELLEAENIQEDFELAQTSLEEGSRLAKTYLQMASIYSPEFAPGDLNDIVKETAASAKALAADLAGSDFSVSTQLDPDIGSRDIDARQLKMALFNLCKNAVEALASNETRQAKLNLSIVASEGAATIVIADNGPGMPREIADQLFVPFKTKKEGGTGLGLAITKKIIDVHGGSITCETGEDGTRFVVRI
ncbi:MAG: HAMP domain-containing histidine kinase [Lentisphaerae bacterium]|nr:HAMP domain-containing histidine kinase [Lentisphaerota bacterium]